MSVFSYCIECIIDMDYKQQNRLNVLINKCAHRILGIKSYRMTTLHNLKSLNWLTIQQMAIYQSLKVIHRIVTERQPSALVQYLHSPTQRENTIRINKYVSLQHKYITKKCKNSFFHRTLYIYNDIAEHMKILTPKKFKNSLKNYIRTNYEPRNIPRIPDN